MKIGFGILILSCDLVCNAQSGFTFGDVGFIGNSNPRSGGLTAPTLISVTTNTTATAGSSMTTSAVSAAGGNYMLIAFAFNPGANRSITSVTTGTGGQSATNIVTASYVGATSGKIALYGVVNPTTGDVTVTLNGAGNSMTIVTMLFNNVGGSGTSGSGTAGSDFLGTARTSTSDNLTTLATDLAVDAIVYTSTITPSPGGSQSLICRTSGTADSAWLSNSTQPGTAGTTTMSWSFASAVVSWAGVVLNGK